MCYFLHVISQVRMWNSRYTEDVSQRSGLCLLSSAVTELPLMNFSTPQEPRLVLSFANIAAFET